MKNLNLIITTFFTILTLNHLNVSAADYNHCSNFITNHNVNARAGNSFVYPFDIDPKTGKLDKVASWVSKREINGVTRISFRGNGQEYIVDVEKDKSEAVKKIRISTMAPNGMNISNYVVFGKARGACFPIIGKVKVSQANSQYENIKTDFDTSLCRDIEQFFENNDVRKCFDNNAKENQEMLRIFSRNNYDISSIKKTYHNNIPVNGRANFSIEDKLYLLDEKAYDPAKRLVGKKKENLLGAYGSSPLISAYMILSSCYTLGLKEVMNDDLLWTQVTGSDSSSGQSRKR